MSRMTLRDYQLQAIEDARAEIRAGRKRIIIHSGTGTGKTVIAAEITKSALKNGKHVLFLAHRKELIDQALGKLAAFGVEAGVLMASDPRRKAWLPVCVASVPTLARRQNKPRAELIVLDECHHARADTYTKILDEYPAAVVLGLTATPVRSDSRGLGDLFESMVSCPSVAEMMRRVDPETGKPYLVRTKVFAPPGADTSQLHARGGDYRAEEMAKVCDKPKLIGSIVDHWVRLAYGRQTVVFAVGVEHSLHIVTQFVKAGIRAEHLDGETKPDVRAGILARLNSGATTVVSNVGVLTEGWDAPPVSACVLARPTASTGLFLQMVGRALRPYPGKVDCLILDHANCHAQHGFVDENRQWSLASGYERAAPHVGDLVISITTCRACFGTFRACVDVCPYCGAPVQRKVRRIEVEPGELEEMRRASKEAAIENWREKVTDEEKRRRYREWVAMAAVSVKADGTPYSPKFAAAKFFHTFGHWPGRAVTA
jgi:DNA repair protein RadD